MTYVTPTDVVVESQKEVAVFSYTVTENMHFYSTTEQRADILVYQFTTNSTTSYTMSWSASVFKTQGLLNTGTVSGVVFTVTFVRSGEKWREGLTAPTWSEIARTGALT